MKKKIGILGSGVVGQALAKGFITHGYEVMIGTRDKNKLSDWHKNHEKCKIGNFNESVEFGEIVVLAVKGTSAKETLEAIDEENLEGKTIIDTTNPIANSPPENGVLHYFTSLENSLMEQLQSSFPKSNFVKAFNSIGNAFMVNPDFNGIKPTMFICGNNHEAKKEVTLILDLFGFEVEDMGKVEAARAIEPLCILWCIPGFLRNDWSHAFKLLKK
ncbi:MAG: NAD(P)-binding domain-containing protein [Nanoarchaeota archaeon]